MWIRKGWQIRDLRKEGGKKTEDGRSEASLAGQGQSKGRAYRLLTD